MLESEDELVCCRNGVPNGDVGLPFPPLQRSEYRLRSSSRGVPTVHSKTASARSARRDLLFGGRRTVPGGRTVPQAAVTHVGVLPGYARRGISTALARRQAFGCAQARRSVRFAAALRTAASTAIPATASRASVRRSRSNARRQRLIARTALPSSGGEAGRGERRLGPARSASTATIRRRGPG